MDLYKLKTEDTARDIRNLHELWSKLPIETYSNCDRNLDELRSKPSIDDATVVQLWIQHISL